MQIPYALQSGLATRANRHPVTPMKISKHLFVLMLTLGLLGGCDVETEAGQAGPACAGAPIPGAELLLERTTGAPDTAEMQLPGLTSVCLRVETNAASGSVTLDGIDVVTPSDLKNIQQTLYRTFDNLHGEPHTLALEVSGKPDDHYIRVQAHYGTAPTPSAEISTNDEALAIAQGYMNFWSAVPSSSHWQGGTAASAIPLFSRDGVLEAFEVRLETESGDPAGFVVLEANPHRPLLGAMWMHGEPRTSTVAQKFEELHGPIPADATHRFLWGGLGVIGLEVTLSEGTVLTEKICEDFECPGVTFESSDLGTVDFSDYGITPDEWTQIRASEIEKFLNLLSPISMLHASTGGFFGVPQYSTSNSSAGTGLKAAQTAVLEENECLAPAGPYEGQIPGGFDALGDFYQYKSEWPEYGVAEEDRPTCALGCAPTAVAMVLRYWDRRYRYMFPGEIDTVGDEGAHEALGALRVALRTACDNDPTNPQGGTKVDDVTAYLPAHIDDLAETALGDASADPDWEVSLTECGTSEFGQLRKDVIWPLIDAGLPPILNYTHTPRICIEGLESPVTHSVPVYGYRDNGDDTPYGDEMLTHRGWKKVRQDVVSVERYGSMSVVSLRPKCWEPPTADDLDLCMSFDDIPDGHWGRQSAETLSCMCVMRGHGDGTFSPDSLVTHAEFLKTLLRLAFPEETATLDGCRKDVSELGVPQSHWSSAYIEFAQGKGLMSDLVLADGGSFPADEPIDRKTAAWLLAAVGNSMPDDTELTIFKGMANEAVCFAENPAEIPPYTDNPSPGSAYYPAVMAATSQCVFEGVKDNPDNPNSPRQFLGDQFITRIEAAKTLCTARFGHESKVCSTQHDCVDLTCG